MNNKLDSFEQEIENKSHLSELVSEETKNKIDSILKGARKTRNNNIRISNFDLDMLRTRAEQDDIPYQTLISSILHKYVTNQLVEEKSILKAMSILGQRTD